MTSRTAANALLKVQPKTKRGKESLERLCSAAETLFAEKNYYDASVSDIVSKAELSIGTFYIYFNDKLSIYKYIILQYGHKVRKHIASKLASMNLSTRYEMEREGLKLYLDFCINNPATYYLIWQSFFVAPELFVAYYDDFCKHYERQLSDAVRSGEVRHSNLEVISYVIMGANNFLALKYVIFGPPSGLTDEQLYRIVDEMMMLLKHGMFIDNGGR